MARLRHLLAALQGLLLGLWMETGAPARAQTPDGRAFELARASHTQAAYQDFIARFPDSPLIGEAFRAIIDLAVIPTAPDCPPPRVPPPVCEPLARGLQPGTESLDDPCCVPTTRSLDTGSEVAAALY